MQLREVRRRERIGSGLILALLLVPAALIAQVVDRTNERVTFLRWIDDQAGVDRGAWPCPDCTELEGTFYRNVRDIGASLNPDFETLAVDEKWAVLRHPDMNTELESFVMMMRIAF